MSFGLANYETVFGLFVDQKFGVFTERYCVYYNIRIYLRCSSTNDYIRMDAKSLWRERKVISSCLIIASLFVLSTLFVHKYWLIVVVTFIVFLSIDILRPAIGTQMSKMAQDQQGYVAGLNSAYTSLGNIMGPIVAGFLFDMNVNYPYVSAFIVLFACFVLSIRPQEERLIASIPKLN